ncbi:pseudoazurin [Sphingobium sp. TomMM35A]
MGMASAAAAKDHAVRMLNRGADGAPMVFEPALLKIAPGDTVTFTPTDAGHNAELVPWLAPSGAVPFKGAINQKLVVRFTKTGLYGYKCLPHAAMGMVGLIQVGLPVNKAEVTSDSRKLPGLGKKRMAELLAQVE